MFHHEELIAMSYTKYHDPWTSSYLASAAALNHIESQWDSIAVDADAHNHDTRYYTKASADATFFALTTSVALGFDCDKLDGQHFSDLLAAVMPLGAIMIWSDISSNVPDGWHICDGGTYGGLASPDLRDRFVIGAGGAYAVGATGGPATYNGTITPTGIVTIGDHQLTTAELPSHNHTFEEYYSPVNNYKGSGDGSAYSTVVSASRTIDAQASGDGTHTHEGSTASLGAIDPRPKYRGLYYIIKYA